MPHASINSNTPTHLPLPVTGFQPLCYQHTEGLGGPRRACARHKVPSHPGTWTWGLPKQSMPSDDSAWLQHHECILESRKTPEGATKEHGHNNKHTCLVGFERG